MSTAFQIITPARLQWRSGLPYSSEFEDVYFSASNGLEEKSYVFLDGNELTQRWQNLPADGLSTFAIGELGFGTGLNFLLTWQRWRNTAPEQAKLVYYSCEQYPLTRNDLRRCLDLWPQMQEFSAKLLEQYPVLTPGYHCMTFDDGRVTLVLMLGEAIECYKQLICCANDSLENKLNPHKVDAWYLDGFAPSHNQAMWTDKLIAILALLSKHKATFATYSAAALVKNCLQKNGFTFNKIEGYGTKRHMLKGHFIEQTSNPIKPQTPWHLAEPQKFTEKTAIVIGAGIAGCFTAHALAQRGWQVKLIDCKTDVAQGASAIKQAVLYPNLSPFCSPLTVFMLCAFLHAYRFYKPLVGSAIVGELEGILQLAHDAKSVNALEKLEDWLKAYPELGLLVDCEQASKRAGVRLHHQGIYIPQSGWINIESLCNYLINHKNIQRQFNTTITELNYTKGQWYADDHNASAVVLCGGYSTAQFAQTSFLPLKPIGGQVNTLIGHPELRCLKVPICADAHILPCNNGSHLFGATYRLDDECNNCSPEDTRQNLARLTTIFPEHQYSIQEIRGEWAGTRASTPDYLPIVGEVPIANAFVEQYCTLRANAKHFIAKPCPTYHGLYVCSGFGSRGLTTVPLSAQWLAAKMNHESYFIPDSMKKSLSPARFLFKDLIRGKFPA